LAESSTTSAVARERPGLVLWRDSIIDTSATIRVGRSHEHDAFTADGRIGREIEAPNKASGALHDRGLVQATPMRVTHGQNLSAAQRRLLGGHCPIPLRMGIGR
jgi:hypothetical protein